MHLKYIYLIPLETIERRRVTFRFSQAFIIKYSTKTLNIVCVCTSIVRVYIVYKLMLK